ncbi:MAG: CvpA family protein [Burkholderiales bacterium]|nr:CvpA family protein [Burkholderiales bacterium]
MTLVDHAVLVIVGFSVLLSVIRGLVREVLALAAWIIAAVVAWLFGAKAAVWMPDEIPGEELRGMVAAALVFIAVLLAMSLVAVAVSQLVKSSGLSTEDRLLGALFGVLRGLVVVAVLAVGAGATTLPAQPVWREATLRPLLEMMGMGAKSWLPPGIAQHIKYG